MSLVITPGERPPAISSGTSASVSAVLPEPTGPPMPMRNVSVVIRSPSTGEQPRVGALVGGRGDVDEWGEAAEVTERAIQRGVRHRLDHRCGAARRHLRAAVVGEPEAQGGADEAVGEGEQVAGD